MLARKKAGNSSVVYILGVNTGPHDGSAALLHDGILVAMVEQERLSRKKRAFGEAPVDAIAACLRAADISLDDVEEIAVGWDVPQLATVEGTTFDQCRFQRWLLPPPRLPARRPPPLRFVAHHVAHAESAFWSSGFDSAALLVVDGRGEVQATTLGLANQVDLTVLRQWDTMQSLGHFYGFAAEWAGLTVWDAGKLMGLAAYGQPTQPLPLQPTVDGYDFIGRPETHRRVGYHYFQLRSYLRDHFRRHNYPFSPGTPAEQMAHAAFAASVQRALEDAVCRLARLAREETGCDRLVLAGGVALNCTLNGRLAQEGIFARTYVPPVPHDAGVSLGAALAADRALRGCRRPAGQLPHAYWGPPPAGREVEAALRSANLPATRLSAAEIVDRTVTHLNAGRLVGWWQGRAEVGQRALGARSILCDPRDRWSLVRLNTVKGRETWRPLAPSILSERAHELFATALPPHADSMLVAASVRPEQRHLIPAAVHVDGSARPQLVHRSTNPRFWSVIDGFRQLTGIPAVINTSFNLAGEPIVFSATDAISSFCRSELDVLVLDNFIVEKPTRDTAARRRPMARLGPELDFTPWEHQD